MVSIAKISKILAEMDESTNCPLFLNRFSLGGGWLGLLTPFGV